MNEPALSLIEFRSIAKGIFAADALAKKAPVNILNMHPICPGKYMVIFAGEVADVEESHRAAMEAGGDSVIADLFLPHIHPDIIPAVAATTTVEEFKSIGIVETFSVAACIVGADQAAKASPIQLVEIRLANGLGGKGFFVLTGELADVEASVEVASEHIQKEGMLAGREIIAAPHPDLIEKGVYW